MASIVNNELEGDTTSITSLHLQVPLAGTDDALTELVLSCDFSFPETVWTAKQDSLFQGSYTLDYAKIAGSFIKAASQTGRVDEPTFRSIQDVAEEMARRVFLDQKWNKAVKMKMELWHPWPRPDVQRVGVVIHRRGNNFQDLWTKIDCGDDYFVYRGMRTKSIVGVNPEERRRAQPVSIDMDAWPEGALSRFDWQKPLIRILGAVRSIQPLTLESLCLQSTSSILGSTSAMDNSLIRKIRISTTKPTALASAFGFPFRTDARTTSAGPSIRLSRQRGDITSRREYSTSTTEPGQHIAFLGLGSNLGDRSNNIQRALRKLVTHSKDRARNGAVKVLDTSFLYESEPMYVTDQPKFLNAVCKISTRFDPPELLAHLKAIEQSLGRPSPRPSSPELNQVEDVPAYIPKGPRVVDLDILLYDQEVFTLETDKLDPTGTETWLKVPHPAMVEREFVLRPLADLIPDQHLPLWDQTPASLLTSLVGDTKSPLHKITPFSNDCDPRHFTWPTAGDRSSQHTLLMTIMNTTPDSFSDGAMLPSLEAAHAAALEHASNGADILDIGGYSTRPGADFVTEEEELQRVLPLITKIRSESKLKVPISVDTFRSGVARRCIVEGGANIVNDVFAGQADGEMLITVADLDVPIILMHARGDPKTMGSLTDYDKLGGLVKGVRKELADRVREAIEKGIRRWNIIIDPGLGFAKGDVQNTIEILKNLPAICGRQPDGRGSLDDPDSRLLSGFPVLLGPSRKSFVGKLLPRPETLPKDRDWGTSAIVTAGVAMGMDIMRVHATKEMKDCIAIADAIYR